MGRRSCQVLSVAGTRYFPTKVDHIYVCQVLVLLVYPSVSIISFARCISTPGKAALLFGKGSGLAVEGTGRPAGGFAKVESYLNKNRQRTHFF